MNNQDKSYDTMSMAAFIVGLLSILCCNPCYMLSIAALALGISALGFGTTKKGLAIAGSVIAGVGIFLKFIFDFFIFPIFLPLLVALWFEKVQYVYF